MPRRKAVPVSQFWRPPPEAIESLDHGKQVEKRYTQDAAKRFDLDQRRRRRTETQQKGWRRS